MKSGQSDFDFNLREFCIVGCFIAPGITLGDYLLQRERQIGRLLMCVLAKIG